MIEQLNLQDPLALGLLVGTAGMLVILFLLVFALLAVRRSAKATEPLADALRQLGQSVQTLDQGQQQLTGGLRHVSEAQAIAQAKMVEVVERRLEEVQKNMGESLHGSSQKTTRSLTELQERLAVIDKAQTNIEKLSGDVLSLQDILSNKQARGAFGEIQLNDIVTKALPPDAYAFQATLTQWQARRLPVQTAQPPGLDRHRRQVSPRSVTKPCVRRIPMKPGQGQWPQRRLLPKPPCRRHVVRDLSDKVHRRRVKPRTAALMFLPSEAVYAELHASFRRRGAEKASAARVWIVSPTTVHGDPEHRAGDPQGRRMREQAGAIRRELGLLHKDVERLVDRVGNLDKHLSRPAATLSKSKPAPARRAVGR